jgi:2,3,4,5-tetrahydropyridine-2-carboxylate N-succinyltransferase
MSRPQHALLEYEGPTSLSIQKKACYSHTAERSRLQQLIETISQDKAQLATTAGQRAVEDVIFQLDTGTLRVCSQENGVWITHTWVKQAILLYFSLARMKVTELGPFTFYDKIPLKKNMQEQGVRVAPPGTVCYGSFLERGCVVMPGYVNIGAYVGAETMVDTWATVGSCAQIGKHVHLSGGVGIGGVLEPAQVSPVIIEDGAFIGSRCVVVEGVHIGTEAVLGAGVTLTASTPIIDVRGPQEVVTKGVIPPRAVVVPGTRAKVFPAGTYNLPCALIISERTPNTNRKTSLNDVLRRFDMPV